MKKPLLGQKVAALVANGFAEKDLILTQKALLAAGADLRIVSVNNGLVNSWTVDGEMPGWGLNFAADDVLSKALAADYDMLVVPGGQRSVEKLQLTAHTRRFIGGFVDAGKPAAFFAEGLELLLFAERAQGLDVSGPEALRERAEAAGAVWSEAAFAISNAVITGQSDAQSRESYVEAVSRFLQNRGVSEEETLLQAAAA